MPVLGICRGMQLINVACGGTLVQHLPERFGHEEHRRVPGSFDGAEHDVILTEGSLAARAAGEVVHATKSHHHQGVDRLGEGLLVSGVSMLDELPEAIELRGRDASCSACSGTPRPTSRARSSARSSTRRAASPTARPGGCGQRESARWGDGATYTPRPVRLSKAIRATAWGMVVAGVAAPLVRKRVSAPPLARAGGRLRRAARTVRRPAPLARARRRRRARCRCGRTWPRTSRRTTTPERSARACTSTTRSSPTACSAWASCRRVRLQRRRSRAAAPPRRTGRALDRVLVWAHWSWFLVPHGSLAYILVRHRERFPRAAVMTYAVFDSARASTGCADRATVVRRRGAPPSASGAGARRAAA